jgi:hypothetical protein
MRCVRVPLGSRHLPKQNAMNRARVLIVTVVLAALPLTGCTWLRELMDRPPSPPKGTEPLPERQASSFVRYVNDHAAQLQTLEYGDVRLVASDHSVPMPGLRGNLAASQPRNFRMTGSTVGTKVDLGSNPDQFWVYFDAPANKPMFVFASHNDFEDGKARLPGGLPFEPNWVMQALGMTTLPPNAQYTVSIDQKARTYTLSWPAVTPGRVSVVKEIVFDGDRATDPRPQVRKHIVREPKGKVICSAEIKHAKTVAPRASAGPGAEIQYPTVVVLRWEEQKFEMKMELEKGVVNRQFSAEDARDLFTRPNVPNTRPIDLARYDELQRKN